MLPSPKDFKQDRLGHGISIVHNINLPSAQAFFGKRMLGPKEVHEFSLVHPDLYYRNLYSYYEGYSVEGQELPSSFHLYMALAITSKIPLGEYSEGGNLIVRASSIDDPRSKYIRLPEESREITIPESKLEQAARHLGEANILHKGNVLVLITGGYTCNQTGTHFDINFTGESLDNLAQFMKILDIPQDMESVEKTYRVAVEGMPVGEAAEFKSGKRDCLWYTDGNLLIAYNPLGSVMRNMGSNSALDVLMGESISESNTILINDE